MKPWSKWLGALLCCVLVLTLCLFLHPVQANAATEGYYTYTVSNEKATITDCRESAKGDITIPSTLNGYPVVAIGKDAFRSCTNLTSVTIPNGVVTIGDNAFYWCTGLVSVTIPNSVTSIGTNSFAVCKKLTSVTVPNSVTTIGKTAFEGCTALTSVTIGSNVSSIGYGAFSDCSSLTDLNVSKNNTHYCV